MAKREPLDARTLRWCARQQRAHERLMRAFQTDAENLKPPRWQKESAYYMAKAHAYGNAASLMLIEARRIERARKRTP